MNKKSFWTGFAIGGILFIITAASIVYKFTVQSDISLNQVEVTNLNGNKINLNKYLGKPLIVNYWATWCAPCLEEFPHFQEVKNEFGDNVNFIMISDESAEKIMQFSKSKPYNFNYLRSTKNLSDYGINARPTTYFYDSTGKLLAKHSSTLDVESLKKLIEQIK